MTSLKIAALNINGGVEKKKIELKLLLEMHNLDIFLLSETKLNNIISHINIPGYKIYLTNHPDGTAHGGSALIIRSSIKYDLRHRFLRNDIQATTVMVRDRFGPCAISSVYCSTSNIKEPMFQEYFLTLGERFIVGGDWNSKHPDWGSKKTNTNGRELKKCIHKYNLITFFTKDPTYWPSDPKRIPDILDFFITKETSDLHITIEPCMDSSSDHILLILTLNMILTYDTAIPLYNDSTNWRAFRQFLDSKFNLDIKLETEEDLDNAVKHFTDTIQFACWECTTQKIATNSSKFPIEVKEMLLKNRKLREDWHTSRTVDNKRKYDKNVEEMRKELDNVVDSETLNKSTEFSKWVKPPIRLINNYYAEDNCAKAKAFAEVLASIFSPNELGNVNDDELKVEEILKDEFPSHVSIRELRKQIERLNGKKEPGHDLITKKVLQELSQTALKLLSNIFNAVLNISYFPQQWKKSQMVMVYISGLRNLKRELSSYRPVNFLPIFSELLEKIILQNLQPLIKKDNIIPEQRIYFKQRQITRVCEKIRKSQQFKEYCASAFLVTEQAFDSLCHRRLLYKIKTTLPHNYYKLILSYLSKRLYQVKEGDSCSQYYEIKAGVPQGSVLGPVLYMVFLADLPQIENVTIAAFDDEFGILTSENNSETASKNLKEALEQVEHCFKTWRVTTNVSKSSQIIFTSKQFNCPPLLFNNKELTRKKSVKFLEMYLDEKLRWSVHINNKKQEAKQRYSNLKHLLGKKSKKSVDDKIIIFKSRIQPTWKYGIQHWGSAAKTHIKKIQCQQNTILRSIQKERSKITIKELHRNLKVNTVMEDINIEKLRYKKYFMDHPDYSMISGKMSRNNSAAQEEQTSSNTILQTISVIKEDYAQINGLLTNIKDEIKDLRDEIKKVMDKPKETEEIKKKLYQNIRVWLDMELQRENPPTSDKELQGIEESAISSATIPGEASRDNNNISDTKLHTNNDALSKRKIDIQDYNEKMRDIEMPLSSNLSLGASTDDRSDKPGPSNTERRKGPQMDTQGDGASTDDRSDKPGPSNTERRKGPQMDTLGDGASTDDRFDKPGPSNTERRKGPQMDTQGDGILTEVEATESENSKRSNEENPSSSNEKLQETRNDAVNKKRTQTEMRSDINQNNNEKRIKMKKPLSSDEALTKFETIERGYKQDLKHFFNEKLKEGNHLNQPEEIICNVIKNRINEIYLQRQLMRCRRLDELENEINKLIENQCKNCSSYKHPTIRCSRCDKCGKFGHETEKCRKPWARTRRHR